jgi:diguanylate cyclase (GGDEF)-like protein
VADGAMDLPFADIAMLSGVLLVVAGATASFSAVNERELRRRRYDLEALAGMARSLEESEGSSSAGVVLVSSVADAFDFERSVLLGSREGEGEGEGDGDGLAALAFHGDVNVNEPPVAGGEGSVITRARSERRVQLVTHIDPAEDPWLDALLPGARQVAVFPLTVEAHSLGVLCVEHSLRRGSRIERRVVSTIERFVSHGALALQNAWLLEHIRSLAQTDGLTGVGNRDTFDTGLSGEISRAGRHGESFSLLMIDVDHFKMLNDDHGHLVGDTVLRRVARQIHHASRESDTVARYGGEEFGVVLPGANTEEALIAADRIRRLIADAEALPAVTVSIGVATFPLDGTEPDAIVIAADAALYRSKRTGRNRVTAAALPANALFV